jgi:hypothetical protein
MWIDPVLNESKGTSKNDSQTRSDGRNFSRSEGEHETLVPEYDNFLELSSRNYESFQEQRSGWARDIRNLRTGQAILRLVNEPQMRVVNIKRSAPGLLGYDLHTIARKFPQAIDRMEKMVEENFHSEFFVSASDIDKEQEDRLQALLMNGRRPPQPGAAGQPPDSPFP